MKKETALEILRELHDKLLFSERTALETFIPELKESEDERIRKAIKEAVEYYWLDDTQARTDIIAWLEKQDEQKSDDIKPHRRDNDNPYDMSFEYNGIRKDLIEFVKQYGDNFYGQFSKASAISWLEKQGEKEYTQKDIDDAYLKGISDVKREVEKQDEQTEKMKKEIAEFIFNSKEDIKHRYDWIKCLGYDIHFVDKEQRDLLFQKMKEAGY